VIDAVELELVGELDFFLHALTDVSHEDRIVLGVAERADFRLAELPKRVRMSNPQNGPPIA